MTENEARLILDVRISRFDHAGDVNKALEIAKQALKEIQQYREMDKKLREAYGDCDGLLAIAVEGLCKHSGINIGEPIKARLLIDEDVDKWDAYREIGTVEECREAVEKQKPKAPAVDKYHHDCCPNCGWVVAGDTGYGKEYLPHCENCGQKILWDERLEETEDE